MPTDLPLLALPDCERALAAIRQLAPHWVRRHPEGPFFTLGAPTYLDGHEPARHAARTRETNPLLDAHFGWLYARLTEALSRHLEAPVALAPAFGRPGFHVFEFHPAFKEPVGVVHVDRQFAQLGWDPATAPDFAHPLSFTLPLAMPSGPGGLDVWDGDSADFVRTPPARRAAWLAAHPCETHLYHPGTLVVHSGNSVHRIAACPGMAPGEARVTLQGHAIFADGAWRLYW